jgi:ribosome maturation factor RimP
LNDPRNQRLRDLAEQACAQENCRLYDLEFVSGSGGRGRAVRVYIDRVSDDKEHVGVQDCANVSRSLSLLLDVEDAVTGGQYELEVSTPGLSRILREKWHFEAAVGKKIEVKTQSGMDQWNPGDTRIKGRLRMTGTINRVEDQSVWIDFEATPVRIPIGEIEKARVVFEMEVKERPLKPTTKAPHVVKGKKTAGRPIDG